MVLVVVDHDPIVRLAKIVRMFGVGEQRSRIPAVTRRVQNRQPLFVLRVESARRNRRQLIARGALSVLRIERKQRCHGRLRVQRSVWPVETSRTQNSGERIANPGNALAADTFDARKPTIVGSLFELFERIDTEFVADAMRKEHPDPGQTREQRFRCVLAGEPVEQRQAARFDDLSNRARESLPDTVDAAQPDKSVSTLQIRSRLPALAQLHRRAAITADAKRIGVFGLEQVGDTFEDVRNFAIVGRSDHASLRAR